MTDHCISVIFCNYLNLSFSWVSVSANEKSLVTNVIMKRTFSLINIGKNIYKRLPSSKTRSFQFLRSVGIQRTLLKNSMLTHAANEMEVLYNSQGHWESWMANCLISFVQRKK